MPEMPPDDARIARLVAALCLALVLAPGCSSSTGGAADGGREGGDASTAGCDSDGVHYVEGQTYCCGQNDTPATHGNTCICTQGQILADGIACGFDASAVNDGSGPESSTGD
jgi:hypothetical protein